MSTGKDLFRNKKPFNPTQKSNLGRSSVIESHGPEGKVRGNAQQLIDRYIVLGKDALRDSDVVLAESYFQRKVEGIDLSRLVRNQRSSESSHWYQN